MSVGTTAIMDVVNIRPKGWKAYVQGLYLLRYVAFYIFFNYLSASTDYDGHPMKA